jgi:hypothetical protein
MTPFQMLRQIKWLATRARWAYGTQALVLGESVYATAGIVDDAVKTRFPLCLLNLGAGRPDPDDPDLIEQDFVLALVTLVHGDPMGEQALGGGPRTQGIGDSRGRGLAEVEAPVLDALSRLTGADGCPIIVSESSEAAAAVLNDGAVGTSGVARVYTLTALCTRQEEWQPPSLLVATQVPPAGTLSVSLSWAIPPLRYDLRQMVLRRAVGATPPASATDGTPVTLSTVLATSVVDTVPGLGTYSYALFAGYNDAGDDGATDDHYSSQVVGTYATAVVA